MSDLDITELEKLKPDAEEEFLAENFASVYGKYHKQGDTVFSMDKGWDVTKYLLKKADFSDTNVLKDLDERHIKSDRVVQINAVLQKITIEQLLSLFNQKELIENSIYRPEMGNDKEYIEYHLKTFKSGFERASELKEGIVINYS